MKGDFYHVRLNIKPRVSNESITSPIALIPSKSSNNQSRSKHPVHTSESRSISPRTLRFLIREVLIN